MSYLARKIARAKWDRREGLAANAIPADAVTIDLRTDGNTLSFWTCDNPDEESLRRVVLALAAAADRVDRMDVVCVARDALERRDIRFRPTEGRTPVESAKSDHVDAIHLDLTRLSTIARQIASALREGQHRRLTRKAVVKLLADAVREELLHPGVLQEHVREEVRRELDAG